MVSWADPRPEPSRASDSIEAGGAPPSVAVLAPALAGERAPVSRESGYNAS